MRTWVERTTPGEVSIPRQITGSAWLMSFRAREHLARCHSLPKYECNRCFELFKEEGKLKAHQRRARPCPVVDPQTLVRNLADGFDQEQDKKLQKRTKKPGPEKWVEWYCILFNTELGSPNIPSPCEYPGAKRGASSSS